jgi:predicted nucleic acid-binding protein
VFEALLGVVDEVFPIDLPDVQLARRLLATSEALSARDGIHVAVMQRRDVDTVMTFDRAFDGVPGIQRQS